MQQRAVQHYEQAADYFKGEESTTAANKCMLKVAQYAAQLEDYEKAIQIYEQVMTHANNILFFSFHFCLILIMTDSTKQHTISCLIVGCKLMFG